MPNTAGYANDGRIYWDVRLIAECPADAQTFFHHAGGLGTERLCTNHLGGVAHISHLRCGFAGCMLGYSV